jgi:hypothetical protein
MERWNESNRISICFFQSVILYVQLKRRLMPHIEQELELASENSLQDGDTFGSMLIFCWRGYWLK